MFFRFLIFILFFYFELLGVTLDNTTTKLDDFTIEYYYDETSTHTINDIDSLNFTNSNNQFTFGYLRGDVWFKININNQSDNDTFILYFTEPLWEKFNVYTLKDNRWDISKAGLFVPLDKREISDVNPAFTLKIASNVKQTVYINAKSVSGQIGEFQIFSEKEYYKPFRLSITNNYLLYSVALVVVLLLNLYLLFKQKERIYLYYVGYILFFTVWISVKSGTYLLFGFSPWNEALHVTGSWVILFSALFALEFLELKEHLFKMYNLFLFVVLFFGLLGVLISLKIPYTSFAFNIAASMFFFLLLFASIKVYLLGYLKMRYYLLALMLYMPTMAMMTLTFNNIIENNDITRYAFAYGSILEILFFNSLMINRYYSSVIEATQDPLSSLYNRRYFHDEVAKIFDDAKRYNHNLSIIMIDIDDFKVINDTFGHVCGDEVIKYCAETLKGMFRSTDIVARYGGEEFIVLNKQMKVSDVEVIAERIRKNIEEHILYLDRNKKVIFTISMGIAQLEESDNDINEVIQRADKALYKVKASGKNQIYVL